MSAQQEQCLWHWLTNIENHTPHVDVQRDGVPQEVVDYAEKVGDEIGVPKEFIVLEQILLFCQLFQGIKFTDDKKPWVGRNGINIGAVNGKGNFSPFLSQKFSSVEERENAGESGDAM